MLLCHVTSLRQLCLRSAQLRLQPVTLLPRLPGLRSGLLQLTGGTLAGCHQALQLCNLLLCCLDAQSEPELADGDAFQIAQDQPITKAPKSSW